MGKMSSCDPLSIIFAEGVPILGISLRKYIIFYTIFLYSMCENQKNLALIMKSRYGPIWPVPLPPWQLNHANAANSAYFGAVSANFPPISTLDGLFLQILDPAMFRDLLVERAPMLRNFLPKTKDSLAY